MRQIYRVLLVVLMFGCLASVDVKGQGASIDLKSDSVSVWPYSLPVWGSKLAEQNINFPLPIGFSVNYISSAMDLEITKFGMSIGDSLVELSEWVNEETLGFHDIRAGVNGINSRIDSWVLPFLNVYGMFNYVAGYTDVNLKPIAEAPSINSRAEFNAYLYGFGATISYGVNSWFYTLDVNRSWTSSDILSSDVGVAVLSFRVGHQFKFKDGTKLALYSGFMNRDFLNDKPVEGRIVIGEIFPDMEAKYNNWYENELTPVQKRLLDEFKAPILEKIGNEDIFESPVDYTIKKDLVQTYSFQFGASYDISKHLSYRAELGVSKHQYMLITGVNYRFGFKKRDI